MLQLVKSFGPMITIFKSMLNDLMNFLVLWFLLLFMFASSGYIIFNELDSHSDLYAVLVLHFESSLGNWTFKMYDGLSIGDEVGEIFSIVSIVLNMILMLNLVIAILSETYGRLAD